jgi:hypothetical protein
MVSNKREWAANADVALDVDGMVTGISREAPTQGAGCLAGCGLASERDAGDGKQRQYKSRDVWSRPVSFVCLDCAGDGEWAAVGDAHL